ncbi:MAG: transketolase family protein [Bacteroides sp.]
MNRYPILGNKDTRSGFGEGLLQLGRSNPRVVALCADLKGSLKMDAFIKEHPERYIECGIAEANMIGVAAGLATAGYIPFAGTFAAFATGRVYDQIRQVVAYSNKNVKIAASHAGLTLGEDGATHQILEDVGMMRMLPNMTVLVPCDYQQTIQATLAAVAVDGPVYLRFGRPVVPIFIPQEMPFEVGKAQLLSEGKDLTLIANGHLVWSALEAAQALHEQGIEARVLNMHTVKPLDVDAILAAARDTGAILTAEEHMLNGGLGDAVARVLVTENPVPMETIGVNDAFGQSGLPMQLMDEYRLNAKAIIEAATRLHARKQS